MLAKKEMSRRQFLVSVSALGGGVLLAACAPKATPTPKAAEAKPTAPPAKPAEKEVEVRYMSWWGQFNTESFLDVTKDFKEAFPNVTIKLEEVGYDDTQQKYPTTLVAGTAADILYHMNFMSQFYAEDLILDLTDRYDADGIDFEADFYHGLGINEWGGKIYGFPHMFESCVMLYNKTMIKEHWGKDLWEAFPDGNWDLTDMLEVAKACTKDTSGDGRIDQWGLYIYHRDYYYGYETQGWSRGDSIFEIQEMKFNFTSETIKQVANDLFDWVRKDQLCISDEDSSEIAQAAGVSWPWLAGMVGMRIRMSPDVGRAIRTVGDKFDWDLMYLPNSGANQAVTRAGGHGHNIAKSTKVPDEAWEFVKFCGTTPGMTYIAKTKTALPVYRKDPGLRDAFITGEVEHEDVLFGVLENRGGYGDHMRFHNEAECLSIFRNKLDILYNEPYETAVKELDDTMAAAEKEMNDIVNYGDELPFPDTVFPFQI